MLLGMLAVTVPLPTVTSIPIKGYDLTGIYNFGTAVVRQYLLYANFGHICDTFERLIENIRLIHTISRNFIVTL